MVLLKCENVYVSSQALASSTFHYGSIKIQHWLEQIRRAI